MKKKDEKKEPVKINIETKKEGTTIEKGLLHGAPMPDDDGGVRVNQVIQPENSKDASKHSGAIGVPHNMPKVEMPAPVQNDTVS